MGTMRDVSSIRGMIACSKGGDAPDKSVQDELIRFHSLSSLLAAFTAAQRTQTIINRYGGFSWDGFLAL